MNYLYMAPLTITLIGFLGYGLAIGELAAQFIVGCFIFGYFVYLFSIGYEKHKKEKYDKAYIDWLKEQRSERLSEKEKELIRDSNKAI